MDKAALINHFVRSEIPLGCRSLSRASNTILSSSVNSSPASGTILSSPVNSSPPCEPTAGDPSGGNAAPAATKWQPSSLPSSAPAAPTPIITEDVSKLDLAIMACNIGLIVPVALNIMDLTISWDAAWKDLYGILMIVSIASTVTGFFTAWCPAVSWGRRLSPNCARFGLVNASALFIVFLTCKLGRLGCVAGVASAALVVLVLAVVWAWSERQPARGGAKAAAVVQDAGLPPNMP